jgi:NAD(P)-dependent dehydrogenase (short-subunit alcohol dehydrogenase family)
MFWAMASNDTKNRKWSEADVPDQSGRVAIVTGANTGIGYQTAAVLAYRGAHVVLAVRNLEKGNAALSRIIAASPRADVTLQALDLSSLDSVRSAADALRTAYPRIDLLINNAGVMWTPKQVTPDGFEMQFGTNHLGHFALTGLVLDHLLPVRGSRVVTVSSLGHRLRASIHFDDLQWERSYDRVGAYGQSKLANLLFTYELQRRLAARSEAKTIAAAAHPGGTNTELARYLPGIFKPVRAIFGPVLSRARRWARCRRCGPPPIRPSRAASTTAPRVLPSSAATPRSSNPVRSPTTKICNAGSGPSRKNSPASASESEGR